MNSKQRKQTNKAKIKWAKETSFLFVELLESIKSGKTTLDKEIERGKDILKIIESL